MAAAEQKPMLFGERNEAARRQMTCRRRFTAMGQTVEEKNRVVKETAYKANETRLQFRYSGLWLVLLGLFMLFQARGHSANS